MARKHGNRIRIYNDDYILGTGEEGCSPSQSKGKRRLENWNVTIFESVPRLGQRLCTARILSHLHGENANSFEDGGFGMKPIDAIQAVTINAADLIAELIKSERRSGPLRDVIAVTNLQRRESTRKCDVCDEGWQSSEAVSEKGDCSEETF